MRYMLIRRGTWGQREARGALEYLHGESPPAFAGLQHFILCVPVFLWSSVVELNLGTMPQLRVATTRSLVRGRRGITETVDIEVLLRGSQERVCVILC